jgi:hypothetical protein
MLIHEPKLEQLGSQPPTAVVARLEPGVQLRNGDRTMIEQDLSEPLHHFILTRSSKKLAENEASSLGLIRRASREAAEYS